MSTPLVRTVEHTTVVPASADQVFDVLGDVRLWSGVFPPTIHADRLDGDDRSERIRIWATAGTDVKNWTSRREIDREARRIEFVQEHSSPPIASMKGVWTLGAMPDGQSRVRLLHEYEALSAEGLAWIDDAVDRNSRAELQALREHLASLSRVDEQVFSFEDSVWFRGEAEDVFDFLDGAELWSERLPHVSRVDLDRRPGGLQILEMDTRSPHGDAHTTKSYRAVFPSHGIAYKQVTLPPLLALHAGFWTIAEQDGGVVASSRHSVVLNVANVPALLGAGATLGDARRYVSDALSRNSLTTLALAKDHAEKIMQAGPGRDRHTG